MVEIGLINESQNLCFVLSNANVYEKFEDLSKDLKSESSYRSCMKKIMELVENADIGAKDISLTVKTSAEDNFERAQDLNWVRGLISSIINKAAGHYLTFIPSDICRIVSDMYKASKDGSESKESLSERLYDLDNEVRHYQLNTEFLKNLKREALTEELSSTTFRNEIDRLWVDVGDEREWSGEQWLKTSEMGCLLELAWRIFDQMLRHFPKRV